jgi:hypothetical protein
VYKYRINDLLANLPKKEFNKALRVLPNALGISINTFFNYRNIKLSEDRDIPYQKVVMLEKIFGLDRGGLENFSIEFKTIKELLGEYEGED